MKNNYRLGEKYLYNFLYYQYEIKKLLERVRLIELDVHAQNYNNELHSQGISDPVAKLFERREQIITQIKSRQEIIKLVNNFLDLLRADTNKYPDGVLIIELIYFCKVKLKEVAHKLGISERTLYHRKKKIIKYFAENMKEA